MHRLLRFIAPLLIGTCLVPTHWCCAFGLSAPSCRAASAAEIQQPIRGCCAAAARIETAERTPCGLHDGEQDSACCRAATATLVAKVVVLPEDPSCSLYSDAFVASPSLPVVGRSFDRDARVRCGPELLTLLCRRNC